MFSHQVWTRYQWFLIKYELGINDFVSLNCLFSFVRFLSLFIISNRETHRSKQFSSQKNDCFIHIFDKIKVSSGTGVNRALPSLDWVSFEITFTVSLITFLSWKRIVLRKGIEFLPQALNFLILNLFNPML